MTDPRKTEERLRSHLDANQVMRERLCIALMPLLGPFSYAKARRPKGGPDGARDIEALHEGSTVVWGAVGFKNGGGNDSSSRREIRRKFLSDLSAAIKENPLLRGFVFFTNVDITPDGRQELLDEATKRGISFADLYDIERLTNALNSPEGLIARIQFLGIPMTETEQLSLVSKFGDQLQQAIVKRFDRVENVLSTMERMLALQRPIYRIDLHIYLKPGLSTKNIDGQFVLFKLDGLYSYNQSFVALCGYNKGG